MFRDKPREALALPLPEVGHIDHLSRRAMPTSGRSTVGTALVRAVGFELHWYEEEFWGSKRVKSRMLLSRAILNWGIHCTF